MTEMTQGNRTIQCLTQRTLEWVHLLRIQIPFSPVRLLHAGMNSPNLPSAVRILFKVIWNKTKLAPCPPIYPALPAADTLAPSFLLSYHTWILQQNARQFHQQAAGFQSVACTASLFPYFLPSSIYFCAAECANKPAIHWNAAKYNVIYTTK